MKLEPLGIVYGKTSPYEVDAIGLIDVPIIAIGKLIRIITKSSDGKDDILGRISSVWSKNRLLENSDFLPRYKTMDLYESNKSDNIELAQDFAQSTGFTVNIIGMQIANAFIRPRSPIMPGQIIYLADDDFIKSFFKTEQTLDLGRLRDNLSVRAYVNYEKMVTHHFSVLAMTGAGKSYLVGVILEQLYLQDKLRLPILLIDPHSEYSATLIPDKEGEESEQISNSVYTYIPGTRNNLIEVRYKKKYGRSRRVFPMKFHPADLDTSQIKTLISQYYGLSEAQSRALDKGWDVIHSDALNNNKKDTNISDLIQRVVSTVDHKGTKAALQNKLYVLLRRDFFVFDDGFDVADLIARGKISIIDLGGIDSFDQQALIGLILRKLFYLRKNPGLGKIKPFLTIIEEAHNFIPRAGISSSSKSTIAKIAAEGRKFGMGLGIITQRPSKIDGDVLSQCNTHFFLRLMNPKDQSFVQGISEFMTKSDFESIRGLATGESMVVGQAVPFSLLIKVRERIMKHGGVTPSLLEELED